jgi:predicted DNA-binding transcriptional regulator AlpA
MTSTVVATDKSRTMQSDTLLTAKEVARLLKVSVSWLAKARMTGEGPPYFLVGRAVRYSEAGRQQWLKSRQRLSTSEK